LIVPKKSNSKVIVYEYQIDPDTYEEKKGNVLYENDGRPFLIKCNVSDIYSNVMIEIHEGKDVFEFQPYLSLMDSKLDIVDEKVKDISLY
jgi:hypothetical protein